LARPLILVVLVDALSWEVCEAHPGGPWLAGLLPHRRALTSVLGFSSGAIPALLTGSWPDENGRWLMYARATDGSPFGAAAAFARLPGRLRRSYRVGRLLHRLAERRVRGYFSLYDVPWRLLPHFDVAERRSLFAPGGVDGRRTWFDAWAERGWRVRVWEWHTSETDNAAAFVAAAGAAGEAAADALFWYTPGLDACQHTHGTRAAEVHAHLGWIGERIAAAQSAAAAAGRETWTYALSDHGMTEVTRVADAMGEAERTLRQAAAGAGLAEGRDWLAFYDSTLARFWWLTPGARQRLREPLRERLAGLAAGRWLGPEEEQELRVRFADRRYGDDIFLADPGVLFVPSYMGSVPLRGMHGYHPGEPTSRAVFLSARPLPESLGHVVDVAGHLAAECEARDR
jgi:hypothetical protein